jgi:hypothetical protein
MQAHFPGVFCARRMFFHYCAVPKGLFRTSFFPTLVTHALPSLVQLLDMGFRPAITKILACLPPKHTRQTFLFSATYHPVRPRPPEPALRIRQSAQVPAEHPRIVRRGAATRLRLRRHGRCGGADGTSPVTPVDQSAPASDGVSGQGKAMPQAVKYVATLTPSRIWSAVPRQCAVL